MKTTIKLIPMVFIALLFFTECKTSKKGSGYLKVDVEAKNAELQINLGAPINTADKQELDKSFYQGEVGNTYFLVQSKENQFKDNAPFIEYLDNGMRERLWFSSSRSDDYYPKAEPTNFYQQVYFCEREIGTGKCPGEGWNDPVRFELKTDKSQLNEFIDGFNTATKGAVAIGDNSLILSCDQWSETGKWKTVRSKLRNLWEIDLSTYPYSYPVQLMTVSSNNTWESQPTLSADGKHMFFVSNRYVNKNDLSFSADSIGKDLNLYYSFKKNGEWSAPILVKELYSEKDEITPHISQKGDLLYFSSNKSGNFEVYQVGISLNDNSGGYSLKTETLKSFDRVLIDLCNEGEKSFQLNGLYNQKYPYYYYNQKNKKVPQAFFWASDNPKGMGSDDIYGCAMPFIVDLNVALVDLNKQGDSHVKQPVIDISGAKMQQENSETAHFSIFSGLTYKVKGGSTASPENGTYICDIDPSYIFVGYSKANKTNLNNKTLHSDLLMGAEVESEITKRFGKIQVTGILQDTTIYDTIFITKAWKRKPPCPGKLNIEPTYRSVAYFQTGYWEVNTTENLRRDLAKLHEGFDVSPSNDIYNPSGRITRNLSDYKVIGYDALMFPVKTNDHHTYSIANAPWIELHPNNQYWGDRPGYESKMEMRMKGRKDRINQYVEYAKKVDENLKNLTDTIKNKYIHLLDLHKDMKPKLLIEIIAVSDPREVSRSWYIGDTVQYRGMLYNEGTKDFFTEMVKIVPPTVDEKTKTITNVKPCTVDFNKDGDNGSILGILSTETDKNTNLSRLRAWYGYKEVVKRLTDSEVFDRFLKEGKVALPDNSVSDKDADIIIITYGRRDKKLDDKEPQHPYPSANNPTSNGFYDYDDIRHIEIQCRLLFEKEKKVDINYCCDPSETLK